MVSAPAFAVLATTSPMVAVPRVLPAPPIAPVQLMDPASVTLVSPTTTAFVPSALLVLSSALKLTIVSLSAGKTQSSTPPLTHVFASPVSDSKMVNVNSVLITTSLPTDTVSPALPTLRSTPQPKTVNAKVVTTLTNKEYAPSSAAPIKSTAQKNNSADVSPD